MLGVRIPPGLLFFIRVDVVKKIKVFFGEMAIELRRVVWPSPDKVAENTRIVVVSTIVLALFFGFIDFLLVSGVSIVF